MDKEIALKLAYKVKYERDIRGLSQDDLAVKVGISSKTVGKLERGVANITVNNLCKIAKVLNLDLGILTDFKF